MRRRAARTKINGAAAEDSTQSPRLRVRVAGLHARKGVHGKKRLESIRNVEKFKENLNPRFLSGDSSSRSCRRRTVRDAGGE